MARQAKRKPHEPSQPNAAAARLGDIVPFFASAARLPPPGQLEPMVLRLREQAALLQAYIGMLDSMSPSVQARIFEAIAEKTDELVRLLEPYRTPVADPKPSLEEYRQTGVRAHELLVEYRQLLSGLSMEVTGQPPEVTPET